MAWYLFPDESRNNDGGHTAYLQQPESWRHLDPALFDGLASLVHSGRRTLRAVEDSGLCQDRRYAMGNRPDWKRLPLSEAHVLAGGRTGVFYHHNSHWPGGHAY